MQQLYPAPPRHPGWVPLMPIPGPLGRLVRRRRGELGLTQPELSDLTAQHGERVPQNLISRIESGKSQRINDVARLQSLAKALELESDVDFLLAAYAPGTVRDGQQIDILPPGEDGEIVALFRRIPAHRRSHAVEYLRILAGQDEPPAS
jgi:transcriptional regulator with XRE-family HTH domain